MRPSHFEGLTQDVLDMYQRIMGKPLDLEKTDVAKAAAEH